jgi:hypothetical protein
MATLNNLTDLIANAKSTPSGKIEWTDTSLKGIQAEVEYLFSQNAIQVVNNTTTLQSTINDNSQLVFVTSDPTLANNGIYFWNLTALSAINFPAGSNGFWNLIQFGVTSAIAAGYIPYSNGSNLVASYLRQTTNEIKMMGGSFVANNSLTTGPYFQAGDTDSTGNDVIFTIDDKNQVISSKKLTANKGIKLDFANNVHQIGDIDTSKGLSVDTANSVYKLGNTISSEGVVINLNNGYIGNPTWAYVYNATTLVAGNSSINLTLNDTANTATLGDSTKGLYVDLLNTTYLLGTGTNGLAINTNGTYTLGNGTKGLSVNTTTDIYNLGNATNGLNINTAGTYTLGNGTEGLTINTTTDDYKLGTVNYGIVIDTPFSITIGDLVNGNGLIIDNVGDTYSLANNVSGKGLFIDLSADTYKLGTYAGYGLSLTATTGYLGTSTLNYRYTATTVSVGTTSLLLNIDNTAGSIAIGALTRGIAMQIVGGSPTYSFGNLSAQIGAFLGQTTGYLGNPTFGYNYTATTLVAGNSSINLTLNDTTNVGTLGSTSYGFKADMSTNILTAGTTVFGLSVDLLNTKIKLNSGGYGIEVWDSIKSVYTYGLSGIEGLYVDLLGSNYSLGGNAVGLNIANTSKTLQTYLNPGSTGANVNGLDFNYTNDTYLLGGEYATKSAAIGVKGSRTATPQVQVGSDLVVAAAVSGTQLEKIRVFIPGVGVRYIPVYLS